MNGNAHGMTKASHRFALLLERHFHLPVLMADERLSTAAVGGGDDADAAARRHLATVAGRRSGADGKPLTPTRLSALRLLCKK